jgi:cyclic beta-1,2-glucan synthetase
VTRWREDATCDDWGSYIFLRDVRSGDVWSAGYQPSGAEPDAYSSHFNEDRAEFTRRDGTLTTTLEVLVSPRTTPRCAASRSPTPARRPRDRDHLLCRTGAGAAGRRRRASGLLEAVRRDRISRRPRRDPGDAAAAVAAEPEIWAAHLASSRRAVGKTGFETDRARFLGRGRGVRASPIA